MKQKHELSLWAVALLVGSAAATVACGSDADSSPDDGFSGAAGTPSAGSSGSSAGSGGGSVAAPGGSGGAGGLPGTGLGGGGGGGSGGAAAGAGVGGNPSGGTGGGTAGSAGSSAGAGGAGMPYGPVSCSPVFEKVCKPKIEFSNGDPNGKGKIFNTVIPDVEATMKDIACTACSILYRDTSEIPANKQPTTIKLVLDLHGGVAQAGGGQIQFDLNYINGYTNQGEAKAKTEMLGVLQHETVHLYQNYGNGGTGEGMADYVRIRMGYYEKGRRQPGGSWKDAYTTSGFFYSWLAGPCKFHMDSRATHDLNIGYKINKVLGTKQGDAAYTAVNTLLQDTFGKSADALWQEYQDAVF